MALSSRLIARIAITLVMGLALMPTRLQGAGFADGVPSADRTGAGPELDQRVVRLEEALAPHSLQSGSRASGFGSSGPRSGGRPSQGFSGRSEGDDTAGSFEGLDGFDPDDRTGGWSRLDALLEAAALTAPRPDLPGIHWSALPPIGALAPPLA